VVLLAVASLVVPDRMLFSLGSILLLVGIGLSPPYPIIGGGLTAVGSWAERRPLDTVVGCALALVATYLLWPRDRATQDPVPVAT
jgi:uncharacterized membrane protein YccC